MKKYFILGLISGILLTIGVSKVLSEKPKQISFVVDHVTDQNDPYDVLIGAKWVDLFGISHTLSNHPGAFTREEAENFIQDIYYQMDLKGTN